MGAGSAVNSGTPTFRTGNITTPRDVRVTARTGSGRDFIPEDPMFRKGINVRRDSFAIERAKQTPTPVKPTVLTYDERDDMFLKDPNVKVFVQDLGGYVRTLDMDENADVRSQAVARLDFTRTPDAPIVPATVAPTKAAKVARVTPTDDGGAAERKAERAALDRVLIAVAREAGYTGSLTSEMRVLCQDVLAHRAQIAEYAAG